MSSMVQPRAATRPEVPARSLPCGTGTKCVRPFARATGMSSESGFTAVHASTSGGEFARLAMINGGAHAADFDEAKVRGGTDEAGEKMQPCEVHRAIRRVVEVRCDGGDLAIAHEHQAMQSMYHFKIKADPAFAWGVPELIREIKADEMNVPIRNKR